MSDTRSDAVTFKGSPVALTGHALKAGDPAPDFRLQDTSLNEVTLADGAGSVRIIASVPSLDTSVCSTETKRFNDEVAKDESLQVYVVSTDLPFGQKRWCGSEGVENVTTLSDHRDAGFGEAYGVKITGGPLDRILCRAVFVVDAGGTLKHVEYVGEIADEPDYGAALEAARS